MIFRYPGGKKKMAPVIMNNLSNYYNGPVFHDVFVGGGSILYEVAIKYPNILLQANDLNENVYSFWKIISNGGNELMELKSKLSIQPTIQLFNQLRKTVPQSIVDKAYYAVFFNRCTFSGIEMSGPIGGSTQNSKWKIDCRYNIRKLLLGVDTLHSIMGGRLSVFNSHFSTYLNDVNNHQGFYYLDPPYYIKGKELYSCYMTTVEHDQLHDDLNKLSNWTLSYDNSNYIRNLYSNCNITVINANYSINGVKKTWIKSNELIINKM